MLVLLRNIEKTYSNGTTALRDFDLDVQARSEERRVGKECRL